MPRYQPSWCQDDQADAKIPAAAGAKMPRYQPSWCQDIKIPSRAGPSGLTGWFPNVWLKPPKSTILVPGYHSSGTKTPQVPRYHSSGTKIQDSWYWGGPLGSLVGFPTSASNPKNRHFWYQDTTPQVPRLLRYRDTTPQVPRY